MAKKNRKVKKPTASKRRLPQPPPRQRRAPEEPQAGLGPMPPLGEGLAATPLELGQGKQLLYVPSQAFARVLDVAEREELELRVGVARERFDLEATSSLGAPQRVIGDGVDFVRAAVSVPVLGDARSWVGWVDLPTRYVGMMIEAARPREEHRGPVGSTVTVTQPGAAPRWQGSHTFQKVWDEAHGRTAAAEGGRRDSERVVTTGAAKVMAVEHLHMLRDAHLVRIEASQVEVLPDWEEGVQAFDYAADLHLPFDPLFLEFEGSGGIAPAMRVPSTQGADAFLVTLRGALVSAAPGLIGGDRGQIVVQPFGDIAGVPAGHEFHGMTNDPGGRIVHPYVPLARVVFGQHTYDDGPLVGAQEMSVETLAPSLNMPSGSTLRSEAACVNAAVFVDDDALEYAERDEPLPHPPSVRGIVVLPDQASTIGQTGGLSVGAVIDWAGVGYAMALRVLAALSIMESDVVVVEETQLAKRDRDRALKRGWNIADEVYVRPVRKGKKHEAAPGHEREYSHRFWVRGHTKHFPVATRMAAARPDLVKFCTRSGEAACDGGMCRRVWTPPFVKGPDDKPLVVKSLVKKVEKTAA